MLEVSTLLVEGGVVIGRTCVFKNSDNVDSRTLTTEVTVTGGQYALTVEKCVDQCISDGFTAAGVELAQQCCT
jgi:hypothetical protein